MKRDWIKLNVDMLHDPAYGTLTDDLWRLMIQLNLLAGEVNKEGLLPALSYIAWVLHLGAGTLRISLHHLCERGLVQQTAQGWVVTDFKESQAAPNSTERSRAFRKRRRSATQDEAESNAESTQYRTYGGSEMQLSRPYPVSNPVPNPVSDPAQPGRPGKSRHRHKAKGQPVDTGPQGTYPVEKPVDNFVDNSVEKGRKNSDSPTPTSSTSSLTKYLKPSLNIKLPLVKLLDGKLESEKFRPSQEKTLQDKHDGPKNAPCAAAKQIPPGRIDARAEQTRVTPEDLREPEGKPVDNSVEKGRKNSDPDEIPP